jgi:succinoglycan biosynthesis transport protein ExoP
MDMDDWDHSLQQAERQSAFEVASFFRHKTLIASSTAFFLLLAMVYATVRPATYTATSQLLIFSKQLQSGPDTVITPVPADASLVQNHIEIIQSRSTLLKAVHALNLKDDLELVPEAPGLSERVQGWLTQSIGVPSVLVEMLEGLRSRRAPSTWASADELKTERALDGLRRRLSVRRVGSSHVILVGFKASDPNKAAIIVNEIVQASVRDMHSITEAAHSGNIWLREHIKNLGPNARVVSEAAPPLHRDGPTGLVIAAAAVVLGFGVGAALSFLLESTDRTVRTSGLAKSLVGAECLGLIPLTGSDGREVRKGFLGRFARRHDQPNFSLLSCVLEHPHSNLSATLRRVRTVAVGSKRGMRRLGVTSAIPGEGATTVAINIAHLAASAGYRVLLIDGVSSDRCLSRLLAPGAPAGLIDVVNKQALLTRSVVTDERSGLDFLPLGEQSAFDIDRMWCVQIDDFLHEISDEYDLVIVDLPPLACATDARLAARVLDAFLLVIEWGDTDAALVREALRHSGQVGPKMLGAILNKVDIGRVRRCDRVVAQKAAGQDRISPDSKIRSSTACPPAETANSTNLRSLVRCGEPEAASN